jgi:hypothetical protein
MKTVPQDDPKAIQEHSAKLAATLALKPNADCFKQPADQQVICLTQASAPVLLDDGHGQSIAEAISAGSPGRKDAHTVAQYRGMPMVSTSIGPPKSGKTLLRTLVSMEILPDSHDFC